MASIEIPLSDELVRLFTEGTGGLSIMHPGLQQETVSCTQALLKVYPELNLREHAETLLNEMADPSNFYAPMGRVKHWVASRVYIEAIRKSLNT